MDTSNPSDSALFPSLCNLASFVVNDKMLTFDSKLTPDEVSVLISILTARAEIECLGIQRELPKGTGAELGEAIRHSGRIGTLFVSSGIINGGPSPELSRLVAASPNSALEQLKIINLQIDDEHMNQLCNSSSGKQQFTMLRRLKIKHCQFNIALLAKWISSLQALESLAISGVKLISSEAKALAVAIRKLPAVTDLSLCEVMIEAEDWQQFGGSFFGRLTKLSLNGEYLNDEEIGVIVDKILSSRRRRCGLEELSLRNNLIGPAGAQKLSELIARSSHLRRLYLGWNPLKVGIASQALEKCASSLEVLDVEFCWLGPHKAVSLLAHDYCALIKLELHYNKVGDTGAGAIAQLLLHSSGRTLEVLDVGVNDIGEAGALELAKGLAKAYAIRSMDACRNSLGPRGAAAMLDALATVSAIPMDKINISTCNIGNAGASAVGKLITRRGCRWFNLHDNGIHIRGAKAIADSLNSSACMIETLDLSENEIRDAGIKYLFNQIIRKPGSICELWINLSDIEVEGAMAIKRAIETQGALRKLWCGGRIRGMKVEAILHEAKTLSRNLKYTESFFLYRRV